MAEKKEIRYEKKEYRKQLIIAGGSFVGFLVFCVVVWAVCVAVFGSGPHDAAPVEYVIAGFVVAVCVFCLTVSFRALSKVGKMNKDRYGNARNRLPRR